METLYVERSGGRWECWAYSDGRRVYVLFTSDYEKVLSFKRRHKYDRLVKVS